ncbi:MAG: class I SAM-dependent methyltransferase [Candidatus Shapirobacteria bacterium]
MDKLSIWFIDTPFRRWFLDRATKKYYFEYFNELKNKTVLEIGCGSGLGAKIILKYFSPRKILATDLDPRLIAIAKKNIQEKEITFEMADATKLNYKNESFDAVFDYGVIHHIPFPEWKRCLNEIYRVLKAGGKVFLYDVSIESFNTIYGKIIRLTSAHPYSKMYRKKEFINYLSEIGFKIIKKVEEPRYFAIVAKK